MLAASLLDLPSTWATPFLGPRLGERTLQSAGGGFYFIAPRGGKKEMRQQGDAAPDEAMDETDLLEY